MLRRAVRATNMVKCTCPSQHAPHNVRATEQCWHVVKCTCPSKHASPRPACAPHCKALSQHGVLHLTARTPYCNALPHKPLTAVPSLDQRSGATGQPALRRQRCATWRPVLAGDPCCFDQHRGALVTCSRGRPRATPARLCACLCVCLRACLHARTHALTHSHTLTHRGCALVFAHTHALTRSLTPAQRMHARAQVSV